jgi:hypothetical protein
MLPIICQEFISYATRYDELFMEPLRIILTLKSGARLAHYDHLCLDNLLARAVVDEATKGTGLPDTTEAYSLPIPLKCLWRSKNKLPLWAATQFMPGGQNATDITYYHKRAQSGRFTGVKNGHFAIRPTDGRWMERRMPLPTTIAEYWHADAIGNPQEIARLLSHITFVGKFRTKGMGEVLKWDILSLAEFSLVQAGKLAHALPLEAMILLDGLLPQGESVPIGWTPPQWKPSLFLSGWPCGTTIEH